jgi:hypothetical protein
MIKHSACQLNLLIRGRLSLKLQGLGSLHLALRRGAAKSLIPVVINTDDQLVQLAIYPIPQIRNQSSCATKWLYSRIRDVRAYTGYAAFRTSVDCCEGWLGTAGPKYSAPSMDFDLLANKYGWTATHSLAVVLHNKVKPSELNL